jgi:hypothetical protein
MKRMQLIKKLTDNGWWFLREGHKHTIYTNGIRQEPIERHNEIPEPLARAILKRNGIQ